MIHHDPHASAHQLFGYLDGALSPDEAWQLERHLARCHRCSLELEGVAQLEEVFHQAAAQPKPPVRHTGFARLVPFVAAAAAFTLWLSGGAERGVVLIDDGQVRDGSDGSMCSLPDDGGGVCSDAGEASMPLESSGGDEASSYCSQPELVGPAACGLSAGGLLSAGPFTPLDG